MASSQERRLGQASHSSSSRTQTESEQAPRTLRLRGRHNTNERSVQWADDVVDNEGLGRKSSKVCCIYHKPKAVGESSDESSSSSSSESDSESDAGNLDGSRRRRPPKSKRHTDGEKNDHDGCDHGHDHGKERRSRRRGQGEDGKTRRKPSPNAYEKVPKVRNKEGQGIQS